MKKTAYLFGLILLLSLPEILSAQLPKGIRVPTGESTGGGVPPPANPDQHCNLTYYFTVGVYNLDLVNNLDYSNLNAPPPPLTLPTNGVYPPMQISYQIGNITGTIDVDEFEYVSTHPDDPAPYIFVFREMVVIDVASQCIQNNSITSVPLELSYSLQTADGLPYPVCDFMNTGDLFDCNYYDCDNSGRNSRRIIPTDCDDEALTSGTASFRCGVCKGNKLEAKATGRNDFQHDPSGSQLAVKVMPNPFDTYLNIKWKKETINPIIRLYDASGRLIKTWTNKSYNENESFQEDTNDLSKGIYFLHIQNGKESIYTKVIKS